jgi:hypothetical protein
MKMQSTMRPPTAAAIPMTRVLWRSNQSLTSPPKLPLQLPCWMISKSLPEVYYQLTFSQKPPAQGVPSRKFCCML